MPTVGRINNTNDLKIKGELIETEIRDSSLSLDEFGNFYISNGELIEKIDATQNAVEMSYTETTQSEFNTGTLTKVIAKSDNTLKLAGENSLGYPDPIQGAYSTGQYGIGFTVNEPVVLNGWKIDINGTTTVTFELHSNYTWGKNLTGLTPYKSTTMSGGSGVRTVTNLQWELPKGTYWLGLRTSTSTGIRREYGSGAWGGHPQTSAGGTITSIKACRYDGYTVGQDNWYYCWEWDLRFNSTGNRQTNAIDIGTITNVSSSVINWNAIVPSGSTLTIETSIDGGTSWQTATKGGSIGGINTGDNLTGKNLLVRESFTLGTSTTTPSLEDLTLTISQAQVVVEDDFTINLTQADFKVRTFEEGVIF
jgi:hypothetical protein